MPEATGLESHLRPPESVGGIGTKQSENVRLPDGVSLAVDVIPGAAGLKDL